MLGWNVFVFVNFTQCYENITAETEIRVGLKGAWGIFWISWGQTLQIFRSSDLITLASSQHLYLKVTWQDALEKEDWPWVNVPV